MGRMEMVPFTLAHAAAAYPFRRSRLILSALIIGTFAPDLEFFLRFTPKGRFGHTVPGIFLFSLPVAFGVYCLFHAFVKEPLAALLPRVVRERISIGANPVSLRRPLELIQVLVSILAGAATHVLWDSFTHAGYWPYRHLPFLAASFFLPFVGEVHGYKVLQEASTLAGCVAVAFWFRHWVRTAPERREFAGARVPGAQVQVVRFALPLMALIAALVRAELGDGFPTSPHLLEMWLGDFVVTAITLAWLGLLTWGFLLERLNPPRLARPAPGSIK